MQNIYLKKQDKMISGYLKRKKQTSQRIGIGESFIKLNNKLFNKKTKNLIPVGIEMKENNILKGQEYRKGEISLNPRIEQKIQAGEIRVISRDTTKIISLENNREGKDSIKIEKIEQNPNFSTNKNIYL